MLKREYHAYLRLKFDVLSNWELLGAFVVIFPRHVTQIALRAPEDIIKSLQTDHKFSLKGTGPLTFHLGCDFVRDEDGTLVMTPCKYIQRMVLRR